MDMTDTNRAVIAQFRGGGPVDGMDRDRLLLLTTTGRRTGLQRTAPMMFDRAGPDLLVIASNMGASAHPDWYLNLARNPPVLVEVGDDVFQAVASTITGGRREPVWAMLKEHYPFLSDHEATTSRTIPIVALTRA